MFLNSWSLALSLCSIVALFLSVVAGRTAVRVLRYWDPDLDTGRQIRLESEIWLSSTLMEYALGVQLVTLVLFVLAAESFCQVIVGAMCATGALLANPFGMPALLIKMAGVFLYGLWIVYHQLDIRSERYPMVRFKYGALLALLPLLLLDIVLQTLYLAGLRPDIITSCCAVVFGEAAGSAVLSGGGGQVAVLILFYGLVVVLSVTGIFLLRSWKALLAYLFGGLWAVFLGLALYGVVMIFSSYVYAMPYHHCPFCLLKPEYNQIGFAIYGALFVAVFAGGSSTAVEPVKRRPELRGIVASFQKRAVVAALFFLFLFTILSSWPMIAYRLAGGES